MAKVIGLTGSIGAGKDVVSKYLVSKHDYIQVTIGDVVRAAMKERGIEMTRENSDAFSQKMRDKYGIDYWIGQCIKKVIDDKIEKAIIDGVRLPSDHKKIKDAFGKDYILFKVDAEPITRFQRLQSRGRADLPKDLAQFNSQEKSQNEMFRLNETFSKASAIIDNSTTLDNLYKNINEAMSKFPDWI
ncbi:MAG: dephospho-CoA kinase [Candidatus Nanoarchaeia archaeon]|nr:dephospho-CoA kinase [Candidatus Nanoarchaeia archaeon]MDD5054272.1 dephospho-CoA kinase [Candidatus Nanoarchaeia archaeon]